MLRKATIFLGFALILVTARSSVFAQNYKIKQTVSMNGQKSNSTTYVRGPRKRTEGGGMMGMGADVATVEQCDLKQSLTINDKKKMYAVEPFEKGDQASTPPAKASAMGSKSQPKTKGGTVTFVSNITDTGERKTMFGMTARHIRSSMAIEASSDSCMQSNMKTETDGWYIDLPEFSCPVSMRAQMSQMGGGSSGGCQEARIRSLEARLRERGLTPGERARLERDLNRESQNIYRQKHDGQN